MLLIKIENQARKLSRTDKKQLVSDVQVWLQEEIHTQKNVYPTSNIPDIAGEHGGWKLHSDFSFDEMYETGKNLQAFLQTRTGPDILDESTLIVAEGGET